MRRMKIVSIHAPARGATSAAGAADHKDGVSIHAPARGATRCSRSRLRPPCFNSRAREGRDRRHLDDIAAVQFQFTRPRGARLAPVLQLRGTEGVSIHAPARGATADILPLYCAQGQEGNPRIGLSKGARQTRKSAMSIFNDQSAENNVPTPRTFQSSHVRPRFAEERMDTKSQCVQGRSVTRICVAPSGTSETGASPVTRAAAIGDGGGSAGRPLQAALNVPHPA